MNLRAKLLRAEQNEAEVPAALRDVEQHLPHIGIWSITWRVLVQLVDENDEVLDAKIPPLQVFTELRDNASEDEILRIFLEVGDVDYVHRPVLKAPEREVAHMAGIRHQSGAAGGDVREAVSHVSDRGDMVGPPPLTVLLCPPLEGIAKHRVRILPR